MISVDGAPMIKQAGTRGLSTRAEERLAIAQVHAGAAASRSATMDEDLLPAMIAPLKRHVNLS